MIKNFTCEFPYSMLNMTMEGDYQTCSWSKVYPKYHNSSPNNFFNSSLLKNIRSDMANGIFSSDVQDMCRFCIKLENSNETSPRIPFIKPPEEELTHINLNQIGNQCNLQCAGCGPERSSRYGPLIDNWNYNIDEFKDIKKIGFIGGEALLMKSVKDVLFNLDAEFQLITNATVFPKWLYKLTKKKIKFIVSIDGVGQLDDYIRQGSNFTKKHLNIKKYAEYFDIDFYCTMQMMNYKYLNDIKNYVSGEFGKTLTTVNRLMIPSILDAINLPIPYKLQNSESHQLTKSFKHAEPDLGKFKSAMSFLKVRDVQYNKSLLDFLPEFEDEYKRALPSEYLLEDMGKITDNVPPIIMYNI